MEGWSLKERFSSVPLWVRVGCGVGVAVGAGVLGWRAWEAGEARERVRGRVSELQSLRSADAARLRVWLASRLAELSERGVDVAALRERMQGAWDAVGMQEALRRGEVTSEALTLLSCERTLLVGHEVLGSVTEFCFERALEQAKESDARRSKGLPVRVLEGLPCSLKDQVVAKGCLSTCGVVGLAGEDRRAVEDGALADWLMRGCGAVVVARTVTPQALLVPESQSELWGVSKNPFSSDHVSGGSSGGEAALVGARCVAFGIGGDIGGSLRIPAAFCGVYTLKCTDLRIPKRGVVVPRGGEVYSADWHRHFPSAPIGSKTFHGNDHVSGVMGPLCRSARDVGLLLHALTRGQHCDPLTVPLPWREELVAEQRGKAKLRIGVIPDDGFFHPTPPCQAALQDTIECLESQGHEVISLAPLVHPSHPSSSTPPASLLRSIFSPITATCPQAALPLRDAALQYLAIMSSDAMAGVKSTFAPGEAPSPVYSLMLAISGLPTPLRLVLATVLHLSGQTRSADMLRAAAAKTPLELWRWTGHRQVLRAAFVDTMDSMQLDCVLTPAVGTPPFPHGHSAKLFAACSYTFVYNSLNLPASVVPVHTVQSKHLPPAAPYTPPPGQADQYAHTATLDLPSTLNLPTAVQIVGRPFQEEALFAATLAVDDALRTSFPAPIPQL